ncbi:MAG: ATP-binding protein [Rhodospirillaceae bacterium]|jgi:hypothetical protein|nr:ATP-binding protein [Rhodospirillaceae bacterium]MBT7484739.1 ATP-binding protein [Rhodospirillales bacterium]
MSSILQNPPDATALMMSARSFGNYDLPAALADLIDNSITAEASEVLIDCAFNDGEPVVRISDNGHGMSRDELVVAMRPASRDPREVRAPNDLGRFGWGMKSASFSQCLRLTVISQKAGTFSGARWDLEQLGNWDMEILSDKECRELSSEFLKEKTGTELIWEKCDRLSENGSITSSKFNELISNTMDSLALIFHRFISGSNGASRTAIILNGTEIEGFDPFYSEHRSTQVLDEELPVIGSDPVVVRPYILPHFGKLPSAQQQRLEGPEGMIRNQGFYVYRNNRLIIHGTWFRLVRHGELSQLFRISVDIPNSLDSEWKITLDKSDAQLPVALQDRLRDVVKNIKKRASAPYRRSPVPTNPRNNTSIWSRHVSRGSVKYLINREHPFIEGMIKDPDTSKKTISLIGIIEQSLPIMSLGGDFSERPNDVVSSETDAFKFREFVDQVLPSLLAIVGGDPDKLITHLKNTEPFKSNGIIVREVVNTAEWLNAEY